MPHHRYDWPSPLLRLPLLALQSCAVQAWLRRHSGLCHGGFGEICQIESKLTLPNALHCWVNTRVQATELALWLRLPIELQGGGVGASHFLPQKEWDRMRSWVVGVSKIRKIDLQAWQ